MNVQCCFVTLFPSSRGIKESDYRVRQVLFKTNKQKQKNPNICIVTAIPLSFQALPSSCAGNGQQHNPSSRQRWAGFHKRLRTWCSRVAAPLLAPSPERSSGAAPTRPTGRGDGGKRPASTSHVHAVTLPIRTSLRCEDSAIGRKKRRPTRDLESHTLCQAGAWRRAQAACRQGRAHRPFWSEPGEKAQGSPSSSWGSELRQQH